MSLKNKNPLLNLRVKCEKGLTVLYEKYQKRELIVILNKADEPIDAVFSEAFDSYTILRYTPIRPNKFHLMEYQCEILCAEADLLGMLKCFMNDAAYLKQYDPGVYMSPEGDQLMLMEMLRSNIITPYGVYMENYKLIDGHYIIPFTYDSFVECFDNWEYLGEL